MSATAAPNPHQPDHRRYAAAHPLLTRFAATALVVGLATSAAVLGSQAAWTAQTQNAGSSVAAGTMSLANDKSGSSLFQATDIEPGDAGSGTVKLTNTGTRPIRVKLTQDQLVDGFAAGSLKLQVHDDTRNYCYYPVAAAGACTTYGNIDGTATLNALQIASTDGGAKWAANEAHTFTVGWKLDTNSPNTDQGKNASFRLTWDGMQ